MLENIKQRLSKCLTHFSNIKLIIIKWINSSIILLLIINILPFGTK